METGGGAMRSVDAASDRGPSRRRAERRGRSAPWPALAGLAALLTAAPLDPAWASTAERVFAAVSPSVVVVEAGQQGSGVVVAARVVATNCHVIGEAGRITVRRGRIGHAASLVRSDRDRDVCLLEVPTLEAPSVAMRLAADLRVGAAVYAVGAPQGLELSLSAGLVSQLRGAEGVPLIQTTAPISPGSSGGGLFDEGGNLVGLTNFQLGRGQNVNFAVPAEWVASAVNELFAWRRCRAAPEPRCVIEEALATAREIADPESRFEALASIAKVRARAGDRQASDRTFASALATAREMADPRQRSRALSAIAEAQARAGDVASAMATAREIADPASRSSALSEIAKAQDWAGERDAAEHTFASALAAAREIADPESRSSALMSIAAAQAMTRDIHRAMATAREITLPKERVWALVSIATAKARAGDVAGAMATAREIADPASRFEALRDIACEQALWGGLAGAMATAREIADPSWRSSALRDIAAALAKAGDGRSALEVLDAVSDPAKRAHGLAQVASALASPRQEPRNER